MYIIRYTDGTSKSSRKIITVQHTAHATAPRQPKLPGRLLGGVENERLILREYFFVEARFGHLTGNTVGIVAFGRYKHPVDIIEAAQIAHKESLRVGRPHNDDTCHTGFAGRMNRVDEIFEGKVVGVCVLQVIIIGEDCIMEA